MSGLITWFCVAVICAVFLWFCREEYKLFRIKNAIYALIGKENILDTIQTTKMAEIGENYRKTIRIDTVDGKKSNIPASDFFNDYSVCRCAEFNFRMLDSVSGTLVGLGLFGTFIGLTMGISGFNSSDTKHINDSIQGLLAGMGTAFYTSLFGMGTSILYTFIDKAVRHRLHKHLYTLTERLDSLYYIDDIQLTEINQQMIVHQLYNQLKADLKVQTEVLVEKLTYQNAEGDTVTIGNAMREVLTENQQQSKALKSFSTDLAIDLSNGFESVLSNQMQQKILPLMENVDATTKAIVDHIDQMATQMSSPVTDMLQTVVNELRNSMVELMMEFKSSISDTTAKELEMLAHQLGTAAQSMADFPNNMEHISSTLQSTIDEIKRSVAEISDTSASANSTAMQQMQEQIVFATGAISNAISEVKEVMSGLTQSSQEQTNEMINKLSDAADKMGEFLSNTISSLSTSVQESVKGVTDDLVNKQCDFIALQEDVNSSAMKQMQEQTTFITKALEKSMVDVKQVMDGLTQNSQNQTNEMISKFGLAAEQMGDFLRGTVTSLSSSVQESVKGITDDIIDKQGELIELQSDTMAHTKLLLENFNVALQRLEKMNDYISGTMDGFKQAQGEITISTGNLRTISNDVKNATELFNKGQHDYAAKLVQLQASSQMGIDQVTTLLKDSGQLSEEYVQNFEVIKQGLGSIFAQLQNGLTEYSRTVKDTTDRYLNQYTSSLTQTAGALQSAIERQAEVTEMLNDSLARNKRS
ncbi:MAG: MotA/TolQ/ExbB proton channel family protein [Bacteroides sp.]